MSIIQELGDDPMNHMTCQITALFDEDQSNENAQFVPKWRARGTM
ncbi:MAG TPA: hypothetical protein VIY51_01980 [Xanthobacteraceae bacterium]